jgi:myxalamid-type nonribosomal peptide synthetase MxaA
LSTSLVAGTNLSAAQRRIWDEPDRDSPVWAAFDVVGALDQTRLDRALTAVVARQDALRTHFRQIDGRPVRLLARTASLGVARTDLGGIAAGNRAAELRGLLTADSGRPVPVAEAPLCRAAWYRIDRDHHVLSVAFHRLIADEWSPAALLVDLLEEYAAGQPAAPPWPAAAPRPAERVEPAPDGQTWPDASTLRLGADLVGAVDALATRLGAERSDILLSAFAAVAPRPDDGRLTVAHRIRAGAARPRVGALAATVRVRLDLAGDPAFADVIRQAHHANREAADEEPEGGAGLRFMTADPLPDAPVAGLRVTAAHPEIPRMGAALGLRAVPAGDGLALVLEHPGGTPHAGRLLGRLETLLRAAVLAPDTVLSRLVTVSPAERRTLLSWAGGPLVGLPDRAVPHLVEACAAATPRAVALRHAGREVTYGQLDERANRLARELAARGVTNETVVAVFLRRGVDLPVTLLAILKAGAAYLPLDATSPPARLAFLLTDSGARVLVTDRSMRSHLPEFSASTLLLDADAAAVAAHPATPPPVPVPLDSAAYVLYTSGSTGQPKGVVVSHRALLNYVCWARDRYGPTDGEGSVLHSSIAFDLTVTSIYPALMSGRTVTIADDTGPGVGPLAEVLRRGGQSLVKLTPAHLDLLASSLDPAEAATATRRLIVGGEALHGHVVRRWALGAPETVVVNEYGPTEATVGCCTYEVTAADASDGPMPIGRPIQNTRTYVLDERLRPCPAGTAGELFIGGLGVARGYVSRSALTAERFLPDPYAGAGARMYRTGDVARHAPTGELEYLGRRDHQVKVRGYRVELGEIEATLERHPRLRAAAVTVDGGSDGDARLVAYVVPDGDAPSRADLTAHLRGTLPEYMVPAVFVTLPELPLTSNGKVDRARLPVPAGPPGPAPTRGGTHGGAMEGLEAQVAGQVAAILGVAQVGPHEDFFELGGHSMLLARLAGQLAQDYDVDLPVERFFLNPSVAGIVRLIRVYHSEGRAAAIEAAERPDLLAEAHLDDELTPVGLPLADLVRPKRILLTGATGFLGGFILRELLTTTDAEVHCLVRGGDRETALARLERLMRGYRIWDDDFRTRIVPEIGDLERPLLGLPPERFDELAGCIDSIYHGGANVNFVYPYRALKKANVDGTREVLRLACRTRVKALHHISAVDVFVRGEDRVIREDEALQPNNLAGGYIQSKWVAEKLVTLCRDRGLPVAIYRPWVVLGHTASGASHDTDYTCLLLKGCLQLGAAPGHEMIVNFMPVDYVAPSLVRLSLREQSFGRYYHFSNHRTATLVEIWRWVREYGYQLDVVSYEDWRQRLRFVDADNALYPVVPLLTGEHARDPDRAPEETRPRIDTTNTDTDLAGTGTECAPVSRELCWRILDFLVETGFLPAPTHPRSTGGSVRSHTP